MALPQLKNRYFLMRHSIAESNVKKLYSTNPEMGPKQHPLMPEGRELAKENIAAAAKQYGLDEKTVIYASPFLRTLQTAEIVAEYLHCPAPHFDARLRERFCGDFDNSVYEYPLPHRLADHDVNSNYRNVENLQTVWDRMSAVINDLEKQYQNQTIILISHGDPLQILYCGWHERDLREHHDAFPNFQKAEFRPLL
jgi:broad specificity phosphatase PhoE